MGWLKVIHIYKTKCCIRSDLIMLHRYYLGRTKTNIMKNKSRNIFCFAFCLYMHFWFYISLSPILTLPYAFLPNYANEEGSVLSLQLLPIGWPAILYTMQSLNLLLWLQQRRQLTTSLSELKLIATLLENNDIISCGWSEKTSLI